MKPPRRGTRNGFSFLEMLTALAILVLICGVAFELLFVSMKKYHSDSQLLNSFQEARLGMDQMVRDIDDAGYPPRNNFQGSVSPAPQTYAASAFAWSNGSAIYPNSPCSVGTTCTITPNAWDLIVETDIDPQNKSGLNQVEWIRYQLQGTTLFRAVVGKDTNSPTDPDPSTSGSELVPYIQNVMNNAPPAQLAALQAAYPSMFPGNNPVPLFQYYCESTPQPVKCDGSGTSLPAYSDPRHIVSVVVTLIVQAPSTDMQTGRPLVVQLQGIGRRLNPDY